MSLRKEALELIGEVCAGEEEKLNEESLFALLSIDSLSFVELVVKAEDKFGIQFEDEELTVYAWERVRDFIDAVEKKSISAGENV